MADFQPVQLRQLLGGEGGAEVAPVWLAQDPQGLLAHGLGQPPVRGPAAGAVQQARVALGLVAAQEAADLALAAPEQGPGPRLGQMALMHLLNHFQSVAFGLSHG